MSVLTLPKREDGLVQNLWWGFAIGIFLTALSYAVGLWAGWIEELDLLEAFAVLTSYICTFLFVMERRVCYFFGAASTIAYCVLFWKFDLLASMSINAFLSVYLIYGWLRWGHDDDTRPITKMTNRDWALHALVAAVGYGAVVLLSKAFDGSLPWTDSVIFAGTILAQFMLDNKKFENWFVWILVNVFAIYTYFNTGLALVGFQFIFFLLNAFYALWVWNNSKKTQMVLA